MPPVILARRLKKEKRCRRRLQEEAETATAQQQREQQREQQQRAEQRERERAEQREKMKSGSLGSLSDQETCRSPPIQTIQPIQAAAQEAIRSMNGGDRRPSCPDVYEKGEWVRGSRPH